MAADLLQKKKQSFVLWRPHNTQPPPQLVIGTFQPGNPPSLADEHVFDLQPSTQTADLWEISAAACNLVGGTVYHYWFEVTDDNPYRNANLRIRCTDPMAWTVDWRLLAPELPPPY